MAQYVLEVYCNKEKPQLAQSFDLSDGDNYIGRDPRSCKINLNLPDQIKDVHAKITIEDGEVSLESLLKDTQSDKFQMQRRLKDGVVQVMKHSKVYDLLPEEENEFFLHPQIRCVFRKKSDKDFTQQSGAKANNKKLGIGLKAPFKVPVKPPNEELAEGTTVAPAKQSKKTTATTNSGTGRKSSQPVVAAQKRTEEAKGNGQATISMTQQETLEVRKESPKEEEPPAKQQKNKKQKTEKVAAVKGAENKKRKRQKVQEEQWSGEEEEEGSEAVKLQELSDGEELRKPKQGRGRRRADTAAAQVEGEQSDNDNGDGGKKQRPKNGVIQRGGSKKYSMRASQLRVMFSNCEIGEEVEGFLKKHGVKVINDINEPFDCLVMDKFRRRVKLLIALNRKSTLVDAQWLWKSIEEDTIQNPADFALKVSKEDQEQYGFCYKETLKRSKRVFEGMRLYVPSQESFGEELNFSTIQALFESGGGELLSKEPAEPAEGLYILLNEQSSQSALAYQKKGFICVQKEFLLTGSLRQEANRLEFEFA